MNKGIKYVYIVFLFLCILGFTAYMIFHSTFNIFGDPEIEILEQKCDYEGLRKASLFRLAGNATTNPSLHVSIENCGVTPNMENGETIFTANHPNLRNDEITFEWISFDTLKVEFEGSLMVFKMANKVSFPDSTLDLKIIYIKKK